MTVEPFDPQRHLERAVQLLQKTNQFNLTTRRHTDADLRAMIGAGGLVYLATLRDAFGDYGRIALAIVVLDADGQPTLDTLLMSCRAIGRKAESAFLGAVVEGLRRRGYRRLRAQYIPTAKNQVCADFLKQHRFQRISPAAGEEGGAYEIALDEFPQEARGFYRLATPSGSDDHA